MFHWKRKKKTIIRSTGTRNTLLFINYILFVGTRLLNMLMRQTSSVAIKAKSYLGFHKDHHVQSWLFFSRGWWICMKKGGEECEWVARFETWHCMASSPKCRKRQTLVFLIPPTYLFQVKDSIYIIVKIHLYNSEYIHVTLCKSNILNNFI